MLIPSGAGDSPRRAVTPYLRRLLLDYWATARNDYEELGSPFGGSDLAMLVWFQFGQFTTRN